MARHTRNSTLTPWIVTALATALTGAAGRTPDAASAGETHTPAPGAAGIGDKLHPGLGNGGYTVRHTALALRFAEDLKTYTATTTLHGRATRPLSRFNLDLTGTTVRSVTVDGHQATWNRSGQELRVTPPDPVSSGRGFSVEATFRRIERAWVAEHRDGTAGTADFIRLASRVAGRDLGPFLRSWLYAKGLPAMPGHPDWHTS
ncbi:hypothetical protein M271_42200 [Streptomyces rapamycinicus NRRL 5491]|uniref:Peptidase M1 membrane alanine aminopeptidase domain-containing protein n=2 Tax=Streptomyces rapamycinicus TaxID=1226757 RepID=A0A0A0NR84_STRRN|nr:hypothetical protein [Streptomyces rapamycinicus]AGP59816.1 hypothetical protein M271_42200 [Streptomyces rapamycinicus NRRL 5491]MBB4789027.1 aminopeptidase N [Streptomyces rapamycinicus]RLV76997.1 hypothetical protein D3C57_101470 [Streptomyces rapamycinicus NRRL 5491]